MRELIEKRKKYSKMGANMERCVVDVMAQGKSRDAAFAICTASLQKAGQFEPGSNKLTAKGKKASDKAKRKDDMDQKHSEYEAMVKSESKGTGYMKQLLEQLESLTERAKRRKRGRRGRSRQGRLKKVGYKVAKGLSIPSKLLNEIAEIQGESKKDALETLRDVYSREVEVIVEGLEHAVRTRFDASDIEDIEFDTAVESGEAEIEVDTDYDGVVDVTHEFEWPVAGWTREHEVYYEDEKHGQNAPALLADSLKRGLYVEPFGWRRITPKQEKSILKVADLMADHLRKDKRLVKALKDEVEDIEIEIDVSDVPWDFRDEWLEGQSGTASLDSEGGGEVEYYVDDSVVKLDSITATPRVVRVGRGDMHAEDVVVVYVFDLDFSAHVEGGSTAVGKGGSKYNPNDDIRVVADYYWHNR